MKNTLANLPGHLKLMIIANGTVGGINMAILLIYLLAAPSSDELKHDLNLEPIVFSEQPAVSGVILNKEFTNIYMDQDKLIQYDLSTLATNSTKKMASLFEEQRLYCWTNLSIIHLI